MSSGGAFYGLNDYYHSLIKGDGAKIFTAVEILKRFPLLKS